MNALIALVDRLHVHHERAHQWFADGGRSEWLSCPLTQNGMLRVISSPRYPNAQPVAAAFASLTSLVGSGHHRFIPDSVSLLESFVDPTRILRIEPGHRYLSDRSGQGP